MMKDPTEFRDRFQRWKNGEKVYDKGKPVRKIVKGSEEYANNVLKLQYLKNLGYNVEINGGWGPSLQRMYNEATARPKEYPRTAFGLIESAWDKITGNDQRHINPFPTIQNGEYSVKEDRTNYKGVDSYRLNKDYWRPFYGASERWKASVSNETNPIVGLENSFGQAATFAGGASLLSKVPAVPSLIKAGYNAAKLGMINTAKFLKSVPKVVSKTATEKELAFFKEGLINAAEKTAPFVKSMVGGEFVNAATKAFNDGDSFGKVFSQYSGLPEWLSEFANPGYLLGGWKTHVADHIRNDRKHNLLRKLYQKLYYDIRDNIMPTLRREIETKSDQIFDLYDLSKGLLNTARDWIYKRLEHIKYSPTIFNRTASDSVFRSQRGAARAKLNSAMKKVGDPEAFKEVASELMQTLAKGIEKLIANNGTIQRQLPLTFIHPNGNSITDDIITSEVRDQGVKNLEFFWSKAGSPEIKSGVLETRSRPFNILKSSSNLVKNEISDYVDGLNQLIGEDGAVAGSLVLHKNGYIPATYIDGNIRGPQDTEVYTTAKRLKDLSSKLLFTEHTQNGVGGHTGTSPLAFSTIGKGGGKIEINLIDLDADGKAFGPVAHQIYRALYPEKYYELTNAWAKTAPGVGTYPMKLPVSAEELLQAVRDPENMAMHVLTDSRGINEVSNPKGAMKANSRMFTMLFNNSKKAILDFAKVLNIHGKYNLGPNYRNGTDLYPNLTFNNIEENIKFLLDVYKLSKNEAELFATNPEIMKNAFNYAHFSDVVGTRLIGDDVITAKAANGQPLHSLEMEGWLGPGQFGGGGASGGGRNIIIGSPHGGWHLGKSRSGEPMATTIITQMPLTHKPQQIITPVDMLTQLQRLSDYSANRLGILVPNSYLWSSGQPVSYDMNLYNELKNWAINKDYPFYFGGEYAGFGQYMGAYSDPIAYGVRSSARYGNKTDAYELGSMIPMLRKYTTHLLAQIGKDTFHGFSNYLKASKEVKDFIDSLTPDLKYLYSMMNDFWNTKNFKRLLKGIVHDVSDVYKGGEMPSKAFITTMEMPVKKVKSQTGRGLLLYFRTRELAKHSDVARKAAERDMNEYYKALKHELSVAHRVLHYTAGKRKQLKYRERQAYKLKKLLLQTFNAFEDLSKDYATKASFHSSESRYNYRKAQEGMEHLAIAGGSLGVFAGIFELANMLNNAGKIKERQRRSEMVSKRKRMRTK